MTKQTQPPLVFVAIASIIIGAVVFGIAFWIFKESGNGALSIGLTAMLASFTGEMLRPFFEKKFKKKSRL